MFRLLTMIVLLLAGVTALAEPMGIAARLIRELCMQKIPDEGAWFAATYRSDEVLPVTTIARYKNVPHVAGSAIYALVTNEDFSAMHQLATDETWHYYSGDPLQLLLLHPDGRAETVILGPDVFHGQQPQYTVRRGVWQGARPLRASADAYTLFGCTLAPGFEYGDFVMGYRDELQRGWPKVADRIAALTRGPFVRKPAAVAPSTAPAPQPRVFAAADASRIEVAPGVELRELIGRTAHAEADDYSVAAFTLSPGRGMSESFNKVAKEALLITQGQGTVTLGARRYEVAAGSVIVIEPQLRHSIRASAGSSLSFYAVSVPAFSPEDYVLVPGPQDSVSADDPPDDGSADR